MVARPSADDRVEVEYVDGSRKFVKRSELSQLSSRWRVLEEDETTAAVEAALPEPPAKSADKATWFQYALDRGASRERIQDFTKKELVAEFGGGDAAADDEEEQPTETGSGDDDTPKEE
jgi:hypothetical protein